MKLKEYPPSLFQILQLKLKNAKELNLKTSCDSDIIVSCTSIPSRLHLVHLTVRSVLSQNTPPKKMVLWLHDSARNKIPQSLQKMVGDKFEIRFTELDSPHCKLVPSLKAFPDQTIVTCDDDLLYDQDWLSILVSQHKAVPNAIIANKVRKISFQKDGQVKAYQDWKYDHTTKQCDARHIAMGYGGILYPAGSLPKETMDHELYMSLCPKADDLWFKAMSFIKNTPITALTDQISINPIPGSQKISLKKSNVKEDKNRTQWLKLCDHFPQLNDIADLN